jgi:hypothetical protein
MARRPCECEASTEPARQRNAGDAPRDAPRTPTTIGEQLEWGTHVLATVGAREPAGEAAALLASAMGLATVPAQLDPAAPLAASHVDRFLAAIARRTRAEPPR